ncbi:MAG: hypothetical protein NZ581_08850, partial [Candidatus Caldarchaeum sp.]|nr:hypothetical protein [Candidatus Caldarchaeum sp.]MDW8436280.1 hypothetical protein [Candidatus Caldarchaeum sp.]
VKLMFVPLHDNREAHYLCGVLNSIITRSIAGSYMVEIEISTHILDYVLIHKFDMKNPLHLKISELSKKAHDIAKSVDVDEIASNSEELRRVEDALDETVATLYGISHEELREIKRLYTILAGKELNEEHDEKDENLTEPVITFSKTTLSPFAEDIITLMAINPCSRGLLLEVTLPDGQNITKLIEPGEHFIEIPVKPLPEGSYTLEYQLTLNEEIIKKEVIPLTVAPQRRYRQ